MQLINRHIRVFVSSTFLDMSAERDQLTQTVFPALERLCRERKIAFSEIDLRWGITADEAASGSTIALCLQEVANCRPFFIGILGDRYGWVDPEAGDKLAAIGAEHLRPYNERSITELEIREAVLNRPIDTPKPICFFYYRSGVQEDSSNEAESVDSDGRLAALKSELALSGAPVRIYSSPMELGELVKADLQGVVNQLFPAENVPDNEQLEHSKQITQWEMLSSYTVGRDREVEKLIKLARRQGARILVTGDTGVGKSSVLAKWSKVWQKVHHSPMNHKSFLLKLLNILWGFFTGKQKQTRYSDKPELMVTHSLSNLRPRDGWAGALVQLIQRLSAASGLNIIIPESSGSLPKAFMDALIKLGANRQLTLVLDDVENILPEGTEGDLTWLPSNLPDSVRLVVSCTDSAAVQPLLSSGWRQLKIQPLSMKDRQGIIESFLSRYGKRLSASQSRVLEKSKACSNSLHLRTTLEELRLVGIFEKLDHQIKEQANAQSFEELFNLVLSRLESIFGREIIEDTACLLAIARRGLTESEMMTLLGSSGQPLPSRIWSPVFVALEYFLVVNAGTLQIRHLAFRNCIHSRYLDQKAKRDAVSKRLALYFATLNDFQRQAEELPWHLFMSDAWDDLADCLVRKDIALAINKRNPEELRSYWEYMRRIGHISPATRLAHIIAAPDKDLVMAELSLSLLADLGETQAALDLSHALLGVMDQVHSDKTRLRLLGQIITFLIGTGRFDTAFPLLVKQEGLARDLNDERAMIENLGNRALVEAAASNTAGALELHQEEMALCRKLADMAALATCLNNQGVIYHRLGDLDKAVDLFREQMQLSRRTGDLNSLQSALGNMARIHKEQGRNSEAKRLHQEEECICRTLGNPQALAASIGNQAAIFMAEGDFDHALMLIDEQEELARRSDDPQALALVWLNRAAFFLRIHSPAAAEGYLQDARKTIAEAGLSHLSDQLHLIEQEFEGFSH